MHALGMPVAKMAGSVGEAKALYNAWHMTVEARGLPGCVLTMTIFRLSRLSRLDVLVAFYAGVQVFLKVGCAGLWA